MKKISAFISTGFIYLASAATAFGAGTPIQINPPAGAITDFEVAKLPQFIITTLFVLGVIIAVVYLIYGGIRWIMSGGDKTGVENARNHIVAAIVGLVILVSAFFILNIVFTVLTGRQFSLNNLCIPSVQNPDCQPPAPTATPVPGR